MEGWGPKIHPHKLVSCNQPGQIIMTKTLTIILAFCTTIILGQTYTGQDISPNPSIKAKLDTLRNPVSPDLLPEKFRTPTLENEYYCTMQYCGKNHLFVLKLRDNCTFIYEEYYDWTRIGYVIGKYNISGDKIYFVKQSLLEGKPNAIYLSPATPVSWSLPDIPKYVLLKKTQLIERNKSKDLFRKFVSLDGSLHFDLKKCK